MTPKTIGLSLIAGLGVSLLLAGRQQAGPVESGGASWLPTDFTVPDYFGSVTSSITEAYSEIEAYAQDLPDMPYPDTQINAMLATIKASEGTAGRGDPYRVCFGYRHTINSLADHPAVSGEWRGETLSNSMCSAAGFGPGCVSTAAGAYQIIKPTWLRLKSKLGLRDFSAASQDAAAVQLLRERGALAALNQGRFADAVAAARKEWASLPGAGYGQGERSIAWLSDRFVNAGGVLA